MDVPVAYTNEFAHSLRGVQREAVCGCTKEVGEFTHKIIHVVVSAERKKRNILDGKFLRKSVCCEYLRDVAPETTGETFCKQ